MPSPSYYVAPPPSRGKIHLAQRAASDIIIAKALWRSLVETLSRKSRVGNFENDAGIQWKGDTLARPSYSYEKRRKEQAKKKKKEAKNEEKRLRKLAANAPPAAETPGEVMEDS